MNILIFVYPYMYLCMHVHVFIYLLTYHTNLLTIKSSQVKTKQSYHYFIFMALWMKLFSQQLNLYV